MVLPTDTYRMSGPHVDPSGEWATMQEFLDYLEIVINGDAESKWVVSDSAAGYVELKPTVGAVNLNDRILIWTGTPDISAVVSGQLASTRMYFCYAPNAGTTGPDQLPTVGPPYLSVTSSLLIPLHSSYTTYDELHIIESENTWLCAAVQTNSSIDALNPWFAGRCFVNSSDELEPFIASCTSTLSAVNLESLDLSNTIYLLSSAVSVGTGHSMNLRFTGGVWEKVYRFTNYNADAGRGIDGTTKYFRDIWFSTSSNQAVAGYLHQIRAGYKDFPFTNLSNGAGKNSYAISGDKDLSTGSTLYFQDL